MESQAQKESQGQDGPLQGITIQSVLGLCQVLSGTLLGLELQPIQVEVSSRRGPAMFQMAGLADASVREARVRVASALGRRGLTLDEYALTVNLAPANLRKVGSGLDMAIALAILGATGSCPAHELSQPLFVGELGLDGSVRPVPGVLPLLEGAKLQGVTRAFVPADNAREASFVQDIEVYPVPHIDALVDHFQSNHRRDRLVPIKQARFRPLEFNGADLADIRGQGAAKRALVIAAAGEHNLLLLGPPGSGKTLLARRLPGLLPSLTAKQALETTAIHSIAGTVDPKRGIVDTRPFRAPHHTVSEPGLIGGGSIPRPGEISLAHHGVLFLDELPEFRRGVLESLRQPLEEHAVHIVRARTQATFPARPLVVAAMNPCPCGHYGNPSTPCRCSAERRRRYLDRLSGPLLERIDLHVTVPSANVSDWTQHRHTAPQTSTSELHRRVEIAQQAQRERLEAGEVGASRNADLNLTEVERVARPNAGGRKLLAQAVDQLGLSARTYVRVLRTARTVADVEGRDAVTREHVGEAIRYRKFGPHAHEL